MVNPFLDDETEAEEKNTPRKYVTIDVPHMEILTEVFSSIEKVVRKGVKRITPELPLFETSIVLTQGIIQVVLSKKELLFFFSNSDLHFFTLINSFLFFVLFFIKPIQAFKFAAMCHLGQVVAFIILFVV